MNKEPLEEREVKRIQASNRSKEWRNANPENKRKYEEHLRRKREEYQKRKQKPKQGNI